MGNWSIYNKLHIEWFYWKNFKFIEIERGFGSSDEKKKKQYVNFIINIFVLCMYDSLGVDLLHDKLYCNKCFSETSIDGVKLKSTHF